MREPKKSRSITTTAFVFFAKFAEFYYHKIFGKRNLMTTKALVWMNVAPMVSL